MVRTALFAAAAGTATPGAAGLRTASTTSRATVATALGSASQKVNNPSGKFANVSRPQSQRPPEAVAGRGDGVSPRKKPW
ncbi:MAG: hypothetical protein IKS45_11245 [Thermoguttaceae bacterium]|nr:hypothetical protein [Thermoguttaceae bacterium]